MIPHLCDLGACQIQNIPKSIHGYFVFKGFCLVDWRTCFFTKFFKQVKIDESIRDKETCLQISDKLKNTKENSYNSKPGQNTHRLFLKNRQVWFQHPNRPCTSFSHHSTESLAAFWVSTIFFADSRIIWMKNHFFLHLKTKSNYSNSKISEDPISLWHKWCKTVLHYFCTVNVHSW